MKKIFLVFLGSVLLGLGYGQTKNSSISFDNEVHDFSMIKEEDGKVSHKFNFVNTGGSPLIIRNVRATCGCTAPDWTRSPVPPGGKGYVAATYNPSGRPGSFSKYLYVDSNAEKPVRLTIMGEVTPKPRTIEDDYRYSMGDFRLRSNHLAFGNITSIDQKVYKIEVINNSSQEIKIDFERVPSHMAIGLQTGGENENQFIDKLKNTFGTDNDHISGSLKAKGKGQIVAVYEADLKDDWGMLIDRINVSINGQTERNYSLVVSANIVEDFSDLSQEELAKAPVANVDNPEINFGTLTQSEKYEHEFILTNDGKSNLLIRKITASCGCTAVHPEKNTIMPGESVKIRTIFNPAGKRGNQNKTVTIITNDPDRSNLILRIKGEVLAS